jgi:hypothetical protein
MEIRIGQYQVMQLLYDFKCGVEMVYVQWFNQGQLRRCEFTMKQKKNKKIGY